MTMTVTKRQRQKATGGVGGESVSQSVSQNSGREREREREDEKRDIAIAPIDPSRIVIDVVSSDSEERPSGLTFSPPSVGAAYFEMQLME